MISVNCAACQYLKKKCHFDCIFYPYFPSNNPERFACVHRIYGAKNIRKMLQQLPIHLRVEAAESLYYEAKCRIEDPIYGCAGIISQLHQQIHNAESQVAKIRAQIAFLNSNAHEMESNTNNLIQGHSNIG
ncbi:LOB domain-containing protein 24-like [Ziziphus jujuba]|uniref:LOB domain-containing protein 24-like n=1 Tax=Ziziphus jujuba TaxID=326968 RepID=A0ABM4A541_ZIZJJ|nr:LOB domain-containing protein 24-like [Ziziphus jujuba]